MRGPRIVLVVASFVLAWSLGLAQPGRGGSQWLTSFADAQRTSWVRIDDKISVASLSTPGFAQQWKVKLDNQPRGPHGLGSGVTASGVTLFVPMSLVTGSSNNVYAIDNDTGYVVWQRHFDAALPAPTAACAGGITSGATRIVSLGPSATAAGSALTSGRGAVGYRSLLGEPGKGVPAEGRAAGPGRSSGDPAGAARGAGAGAAGAARGAPPPPPPPPPPPAPGGRAGQASDRIPGAPPTEEGGPYAFLFRPSGVGYVVSSDGMLHVLGLPSGKDIQRPAPFLPPNARWSAPVAVGTVLYTATSANCGDAPNAVWAIDLDSNAKPVVSWKTNGGGIVGAVAFTSSGTLIAAIGAGQASGDGKANAIVALDAKTLQVKDWFMQPSAEFATGPTILRHNDREIVAAATKDGRIILLDAASLGGSNHATPLLASKPFVGEGAKVSSDALAMWQQSSAPATPSSSSPERTWILLPVSGRLAAGSPAANGAVSNGAVVALRLRDAKGALAVEPAWVSHDLASPATPLIINGVVFTLATGMSSTTAGPGTPAVLHAYDGGTGKRLWTSGKAMSTFASPGSLWSGLGQIYVGTHDGTLYAFGFDDERHATRDK
jgi:outer membrane protein assembly factor BamB